GERLGILDLAHEIADPVGGLGAAVQDGQLVIVPPGTDQGAADPALAADQCDAHGGILAASRPPVQSKGEVSGRCASSNKSASQWTRRFISARRSCRPG